MNIFESGIRPAVDAHLAKLAEERRDYGEYWSASTAGYCMRKNIFERLLIPHTTDPIEDARNQLRADQRQRLLDELLNNKERSS